MYIYVVQGIRDIHINRDVLHESQALVDPVNFTNSSFHVATFSCCFVQKSIFFFWGGGGHLHGPVFMSNIKRFFFLLSFYICCVMQSKLGEVARARRSTTKRML